MISINKTKFNFLLFIIVFIIGIVILLLPQIVKIDYYTNRDFVYSVVQGLNYSESIKASTKYINPFYYVYNSLCQIWGWLVVLLILSLFFKIHDLKNVYKPLEISYKKIIYLWVNLSYILWSILSVILNINDLSKEVYDSFHDTLAIPLFQSACSFIYFSAIYYPLVNIIVFFTYNKKVKNIWIIFALLFSILYVMTNIYIHFVEKFMLVSIFMNMLNIVWLVLCISTLKIHLKQWKIMKINRKQNYSV